MKTIKFGLMIGIFTIVAAMFSDENQPQAKPKPKPKPEKVWVAKVEFTRADAAERIAAHLLFNLDNPNSYQSIGFGELIEREEDFYMRHKYRATNRKGALRIYDQIFYFDNFGDIANPDWFAINDGDDDTGNLIQ